MASLLKPEDILVSNDGFEIRMVSALNLKNPLIYIMHGDFQYYYNIAVQYQDIIDKYICYSQFVFKKLNSLLSPPNREKIKLIYYPAAVLETESIIKKPTDGFKILFAGTINERKGAHLLFPICKILQSKLPSFTLGIIGEGELIRMLKEQFSACSNIIFYGFKNNDFVLEKMKEYDIFLFPSFSEGLPNVLIEALQMKCIPVVSNLESGIPDIIKHGENGLIAETGNVRAFADEIISLAKKPELLAKLKINSNFDLKEKFDPYNQSKKYFEELTSTRINPLRKFQSNSDTRILNKKLLPNFVVRFLRTIISHPKV